MMWLGGELLILGAPGSGKTTLLLELARDLLERAEQDEQHPLPVVFNLSSWATKQQPLADWLVEELNRSYQVPRKLGRAWVEADYILPLLDGLDEVAPKERTRCIEAINAYRREHGLLPLAVCSRSADYLAQPARVQLGSAVLVQPLTQQQVDDYLASGGEPLWALQVALHRDAALRELTSTPLMLSILTLTYQGVSVEYLLRGGSVTDLQRQVLAHYVQRMLRQRGAEGRYTPEQTTRWLSWLAQQMAQHNQSTFFIERMQPDWLFGRLARWVHRIIVGLITILLWVLVGLFMGLYFEVSLSMSGALYVSLTIGLIVGFIAGFTSMLRTEIEPAERVRWSREKARRGSGWALAIGLLVMLSLAAFMLVQDCPATPTTTIPSGGATGGCGPPVSGSGFLLILLIDLFLALFSMLLAWMFFGISGNVLEKNTFMKPNEGIRISAHNSIRYGVSTTLVIGLIIMPSVALLGMLMNYLSPGLQFWISLGVSVIAVPAGLLVGLSIGGLACIRHVVLRLLLWRATFIPWNYPQFLDYAAGCILLRKVGGGYIFIHRLLLEYFASLDTTPPHDKTRAQTQQAQLVS
jgi:DNA polymerase III delta prime subunit